MRNRNSFAPQTLAALLLVCGSPATPYLLAQPIRVKETVHNLSISGPGQLRAASETEICVFCHTPHGSSGVRPLWNRELPAGPYQIYESTSLKALPGQPTGSSKLCLSCHDGTIALGRVLSRNVPITMVGNDRMPPGRRNLGTNLSDDHPISFAYSESLSGADPELLPELAIVPPVRLDQNGEVQCTSCHDAHDNTRGAFLVRSNDSGALCLSCHQPAKWSNAIHATSTVQIPADVAAKLGAEATSLAENACRSCHRSHGAGMGPRLLHLESVSATCLACHDGSVGADVRKEVLKFSTHGMVTEGPTGNLKGMFVEGTTLSCADCHESHATGSKAGAGGSLPTGLTLVAGISLKGVPLAASTHEYELCFRCHGDAPVGVDLLISRVILQTNKRVEFQATNPSFHPVGNPGVNPNVPSLLPPLTTASTIGCGDCHDSDASRKLGGAAPAGPHGSAFRPLLAARYEVLDFTAESAAAYALCYRCHQRESILRNDSFSDHQLHIVEEQTPCSVCHDPHGIASHQGTSQSSSHLINFDRSVVFPNGAGRIEFVDQGTFRGACYLSCHGVDHSPLSYSNP